MVHPQTLVHRKSISQKEKEAKITVNERVKTHFPAEGVCSGCVQQRPCSLPGDSTGDVLSNFHQVSLNRALVHYSTLSAHGLPGTGLHYRCECSTESQQRLEEDGLDQWRQGKERVLW